MRCPCEFRWSVLAIRLPQVRTVGSGCLPTPTGQPFRPSRSYLVARAFHTRLLLLGRQENGERIRQWWLDRQTSAVVQGKHVAPRDADIDGSDWSAGRCYPARLLGSNGKLSTPRMKLVFISFGSPAMKSGIWRCSSRNSDRSIDLARWVPRQ